MRWTGLKKRWKEFEKRQTGFQKEMDWVSKIVGQDI